MIVVSVNLGHPEPLVFRDQTHTSAIRKHPFFGPVEVGPDSLEGDEVADRRVHGGLRKSVYAYPNEHYAAWQAELGDVKLPVGVFGENLTIEGTSEDEIRLGDVLGIGTAEFAVTQPRLPCMKLNARFQRDDMIERMLANERSGFYLTVRQTGTLQAGDEIHRVATDPSAATVRDDFRRRAHRDSDPSPG
ncbi:MAG: MOSC domain-containing protein [Thermoplasmata archaeon]|nr:MOSC domain-containing protein [Thermoplasmata archaeon]